MNAHQAWPSSCGINDLHRLLGSVNVNPETLGRDAQIRSACSLWFLSFFLSFFLNLAKTMKEEPCFLRDPQSEELPVAWL